MLKISQLWVRHVQARALDFGSTADLTSDVIQNRRDIEAQPYASASTSKVRQYSARRGNAAIAAMDLILKPYRVATSKPAQKTYLNTLLFLITSSILLGLAVIAYILFYLNYVPQIGIERLIHLQYGDAPNPYALTPLTPSLISHQPYDISLSLHLPRSPPNLSAGNFMLSLTLLSSNHDPTITSTNLLSPSHTLFTSRRPAILPYTSPLISFSSQLVALPLYIWGWKQESEKLEIPMGELVSFPKGWKNIPAWALLEVQAGNEIQVYDVCIKFKARFGGVRWVMYNHRILSFVVGVGVFWGAECLFTLLAFVGIQMYFSPKAIKQGESKGAIDAQAKAEFEDGEEVKEEETDDEPDLSDTPRTFPTYGRQAPLRYEPRVKDEESEEEVLDETAIQPLEADDEESGEDVEDDDGRLGIDSGIGTSFSEGGIRAGGVARRRSRGGKVV